MFACPLSLALRDQGLLYAAQTGEGIDKDLAVVISSGYLSDEILAAALRAGVRGLLQKEYGLEQLAALVHSVLAEARAQQGHRGLIRPRQVP